uniref:histone deacetylase n=1 Tax=Romanomermis culicivorax TaxID=13658 RepID=A0A915K6Z8_ROMCU
MNRDTIVIDGRRIGPKVGFAYDQRMLDHKCTWDRNHIEIPDRLERCYEICRSKGLIDRCHFLECRFASREEILLNHESNFVEQFRCVVDKSEEDRLQFCQQFDDVYVNQSTFK